MTTKATNSDNDDHRVDNDMSFLLLAHYIPNVAKEDRSNVAKEEYMRSV